MRSMEEVARRFLGARAEYLRLRDAPGCSLALAVEVKAAKGRMEALAWTLGIDLDHMSMPKVASELEGFDVVRLEPVEVGGERFWFIWVPKNPHPAYRTEGWGAFIATGDARELAGRLLLALAPGSRAMPRAMPRAMRGQPAWTPVASSPRPACRGVGPPRPNMNGAMGPLPPFHADAMEADVETGGLP